MFNLPISPKEIAHLLADSKRATDAQERQAAALERIADMIETLLYEEHHIRMVK